MEIALRKNTFQPRHIKKLVRVLDKGKREEFYGKFLAYGKASRSESRAEYGAYTESEKKDAKNALVDAHNALKESLSLLDMKEHESLEKKALVLEARGEKITGTAIAAGSILAVASVVLAPAINATTGNMALAVSATLVIWAGLAAFVGYIATRHSKADNLERKVRWLLSEIRSDRDRLRIEAEVGSGYSEPGHVDIISKQPLLPKTEKKLIPASFGE